MDIEAFLGCFNSILVRLKVFKRILKYGSVFGFNSHTGSIKSGVPERGPRCLEKFQFHTGSIKRLFARPDWTDQNRFQFHTGSIKSLLKLCCSVRIVCFNSILVRLKAPGDFPDIPVSQGFQFHTGSIKSHFSEISTI